VSVHEWFDQQFPGHWRGRTASQEWPLWSPDLWPLESLLWGHLKILEYLEKVCDLDRLQHQITAAGMAMTSDMLKALRQHCVTHKHVPTKTSSIFPHGSKYMGHPEHVYIYIIWAEENITTT
jgi:hypothetical protein